MLIAICRYISRRRRAPAALALSLALTSCSPQLFHDPDAALAMGERRPRLEVPDAAWVPIFFEEIDERAGLAGLPSLRSAVLPGDDLEVRVWVGFGVTMLSGYVIKRSGKRWSAFRIRPAWPEGLDSYRGLPVTPKSEWESFWGRLDSGGILTLPDSTQVDDTGRFDVHDATSYVVEVNTRGTYRTYMHVNPKLVDYPEAERMGAIIEIIEDELTPDE